MPPTPEDLIKEGFEKIQRETAEFRKDNDARLKAIEAKGNADPLLKEKVDKAAEGLSALEAKIDEVKTAMNRMPQVSQDTNVQKAEIESKMRSIQEKFLREGKEGVSPEDRKFYNEQVKTLSVGSDPDGGWFVRPELSNRITQKVFESSPMRELADSITISTDGFEEAYDESEAGVENAGETSSHSDTDDVDFDWIRIPVHQMQAKPKATLKILEDANMDIEAYLAGKVAAKMGREEAADFISGAGVNEARGILSYDNGTGFNQLEQRESTVSLGFAADDLINLQGDLLEAFQANAKWLMKRATLNDIRKLKDGAGRYLLANEGNIKDGYKNVVLGSEVRLAADMQANGVAANLAIAYGDFKQGYLIVDRMGMSVLRDPYSVDNHVVWKFRKRQGGGVRQFQAIKLLKIKA